MSDRVLHFLGHAAFELTTEDGLRVLIDPYITGNTKCPYKLEEIADPDLIMVSHGAWDHLGDTLDIMRRCDCQAVVDPAVRHHLAKQGISRERLLLGNIGKEIKFRGVHIRMVEAKHTSIFVSDGELLTGIPLGFVINTSTPGAIYHSGDTAIYDARLYGELYRPKLGLLYVATNMTPYEAALFAKYWGLEYAMPTHFEDEATPGEFERHLRDVAPGIKLFPMEPGQKLPV